MARKGGVLVLASAMLMLAACSSDGDDATPATTSGTVAERAATTTTAPTTTIAPPTTQATTATTIDPTETLAAEVEADLLEALRLGREAAIDPFDAQKEAAALDRRLGVIRDNLERTLADYRVNNYALRANESVPASVVVEGDPLLVGPARDVAEVRVCEINSWILVEVGAGPGGSDAIVDPDVVTYRNEFFLRNVDGIWRIEGGNELAVFDGAVECSAE